MLIVGHDRFLTYYGTELTSVAVLSWAIDRVQWHYIQPGKPVQNAFIYDYNWFRPHSSLGALTPREFADQQGEGPLGRVWGSADRPLAPPPQEGQNNNRLYL